MISLLAQTGLSPFFTWLLTIGVAILVIVGGILALFSQFFRKVGPEEAIVRSGAGGLKAKTGRGIFVIPILHRAEVMDLSLKRIEIKRRGEAGLICQDNVRADIEVAFYVRVNNKIEDILQVAESVGCKRASDQQSMVVLFDALFSEALKTVGKRFDFVQLYDERDKFKAAMLEVIGKDLNGYALVDCAIDFLEQTPLDMLDPNNILDAQGIKKITTLTAEQHIMTNDISREKEKEVKKQDVEAREVILALERQQVEAEEKQHREITVITAREKAEGAKVTEEERLKAESARIATEEEIRVAEENKDRQIVVAQKSKERTEAVETERVEKERGLEATERERVVALADIDKDKAIEVEKRNIQEVIRERVIVERGVVEEQQRIKDTEEFATADRLKRVTVTQAEMEADEALVKEIKAAEASKQSATFHSEEVVIVAEADRVAAEKQTHATKMLAEAKVADQAASGLAQATVQEAKAVSLEKEGHAEASVLQRKAEAEAKGLEAKAVAIEKHGTAEAEVMRVKYSSEANGIQEKAKSMKLFDSVGKEHEEFKLRLNKDKDIEIAAIAAQQDIAEAQSRIVGEALKSARIDIVGGETEFFDKIIDSIKGGKAVDRFVNNSGVLTDVKNSFFNGNPDYFRDKMDELVTQFNLSTDDVKDLSIAALIARMLGLTKSEGIRYELQRLLGFAADAGISVDRASSLGLGSGKKSKSKDS
ncbi:MAG TPA: flotillin family protein [Planctomycetes bacterium]|nr:flotillin family protein [Planctomycetota bacterium]